jgi:hypothetical protein
MVKKSALTGLDVKPSTERGYMTQEEISSHLKNLQSKKGKIGYLKEISSRKGLLSADTEKNVRRVLAEVYEKNNDFIDAADTLMNLGGEDYKRGVGLLQKSRDIRAAEVLEHHGALLEAAEVYSSAYNLLKNFKEEQYRQQATKALEKAIELYEDTVPESAGWLTLNTSKGLYSGSNSEKIKYAAILERIADKIGEDSYKVNFLKGAQERYEEAGKGVKAASLGKRTSALEKKLEEEAAARRSKMNRALIAISGIGLIGGAALSSTTFTGNVIGLSTQTSSSIGIVLLAIGLVFGFLWIKNKKK